MNKSFLSNVLFFSSSVENMWSSREFIEKYLRPNNLAHRWDQFVYPAMKNAIICSMLVAQDTIETRKVSSLCFLYFENRSICFFR
jgi:hypothetical protein